MAITFARGKRKTPDKLVLMGMDGVGKSTFAANAPEPVFICAEDGTDELDVARVDPTPDSLGALYEVIAGLTTEEHDFQTLVIDTLDWLEPVITAGVCERNGWRDSKGNPDIEKPGYGKGYVAVADEWRRVLAALDTLREKRGVQIVLLAHTHIKRFANPAAEDYDRYELKLDKRAAAIVREWVKFMGFATWEEFVASPDDSIAGKAKGVSTGVRIIKTQRSAAWDAKCRVAMPDELSLDWHTYEQARDSALISAPEVIEDITRALGSVGDDEYKAKVAAYVAQHRDNTTQLLQALNRVRERVREEAQD